MTKQGFVMMLDSYGEACHTAGYWECMAEADRDDYDDYPLETARPEEKRILLMAAIESLFETKAVEAAKES